MNQRVGKGVLQATEFMEANNIDGWLLYDYQGMNPIFWDTVGEIPNVTRPVSYTHLTLPTIYSV